MDDAIEMNNSKEISIRLMGFWMNAYAIYHLPFNKKFFRIPATFHPE